MNDETARLFVDKLSYVLPRCGIHQWYYNRKPYNLEYRTIAGNHRIEPQEDAYILQSWPSVDADSASEIYANKELSSFLQMINNCAEKEGRIGAFYLEENDLYYKIRVDCSKNLEKAVNDGLVAATSEADATIKLMTVGANYIWNNNKNAKTAFKKYKRVRFLRILLKKKKFFRSYQIPDNTNLFLDND